MLHAGAVADPRTHRAVAVVAGAGAGKTTFVRTMGRGRVYLSDETVALREDHSIVPYPSLCRSTPQGTTSSFNSGRSTPSSCRQRRLALWPPSGRCSAARRRPNLGSSRCPRSNPSRPSLPRPHTCRVCRLRCTGFRRDRRFWRHDRVVYHEAEDLATLVDQAIGVPPMRFRRAEVVDRLVVGDECVVLMDNLVVHLSAVPTAILEQIADWTEVTDIAAQLETHFGPPPDGAVTLSASKARCANSRSKVWWNVINDVRLALAEGVPLAHTLVDRVARDQGIRALLIKGPILAIQGLREPRQSGDVDVLCEPARVRDLTDALGDLGWEVFNEDPVTPEICRSCLRLLPRTMAMRYRRPSCVPRILRARRHRIRRVVVAPSHDRDSH